MTIINGVYLLDTTLQGKIPCHNSHCSMKETILSSFTNWRNWERGDKGSSNDLTMNLILKIMNQHRHSSMEELHGRRCGIGYQQRLRSLVWPHSCLWNRTPAGLGHVGGPYTLADFPSGKILLYCKEALAVSQCPQTRCSPSGDNLVKVIRGLSYH